MIHLVPLALLLAGLLVGSLGVVWTIRAPVTEAEQRDLDAEHDDHLRAHFAGEAPEVVERHFSTRPDELDSQCPHLPAHRRIVTAPIGPLESPEVVAYLCTLCGRETYVAGPYDPPAPKPPPGTVRDE